jgi:hypothetical protein
MPNLWPVARSTTTKAPAGVTARKKLVRQTTSSAAQLHRLLSVDLIPTPSPSPALIPWLGTDAVR